MSVPEQIPYVGYYANGITTEFPITFDLHDVGYLVVTLNKEIPQGSVYTVDLVGKKVVFAQPPKDGDQIELYRDTVLNRDTDYKTYDNSFRPEAVNYDFDKIIHILQEQNMIDAELASRLKQEIEWRRTHDANFDELAKMRDAQVFAGLKGYIDTLYAGTTPNIFDGVTAGIVFALDKKSVQTHLEIIYQQLAEGSGSIIAEKNRAIAAEQTLQQNITSEVGRAMNSEAVLDGKINAVGVGNKAYLTYTEMDADKATIPTNSKVTVTSDPDLSKRGDWQWNGSVFTKSPYDPITQSKAYTDQKASESDNKILIANLETQSAVFGTYKNFAAGTLSNGYISKTDGSVISNANWKSTDFINVDVGALLKRIGALIGSSSTAAAVAFYDSNKTFLGIYTDTAASFEIKPTDQYANARYVRLSIQLASVSTTTINVYVSNPFIVDFFKTSDVAKGYITLTGGFVQSDTWETSPLISVKQGQKFVYTGRGNASLVASISAFDKQGAFLQSLYSSSVESSYNLLISDPNISYIRASSAIAYAHAFSGFYIPESRPKQYSTIVPDAVYALKNEPIYLYSDGIVGNADNVAWNISGSNARVCKIKPTTSASIPVQIQTTEDLNWKKTLASFPVLVTDTPINPSAIRYVLAIGDSTTKGYEKAKIEGAWPNECSRRLSGVGYRLLSNELSPAPLSMTNLQFIGTIGDQIVKHEGRGGWRAFHYLNNASVGETNPVINAFWNPSTSQFDLNYYLSQNGFTGVNSTGSNLTIIIQLGWNDVYNSTAKQSAIDLGLLIDKIRSTHANTDIICLGLNQAPDFMFKTYTGTRFVSKREVFESIKQFNDSYKAMIATKTNVDFLQISSTFCSEIGYEKTTTDPETDPTKFDPTWHKISARSTTQLEAVDDHVHPNAVGYAMIADTVFYKLLYKYCR
ncbi:hypothetical protein AWW72_13360 [Acinetobacter sp. NRRL B-65365]|uniref:SGNH/GDSL hydrolase family protein n=1 Tax=Acinetobacter sp. NRRL B-65365 TaxID=1785092 RepID=UPI0007A0B0E1|nr:SGNH/GDSL hydrolase family protein [Acinetobacter sp. NRRL B-65365]KYQ83571.1 hypothetical protein AWW72_13360 [Acinetobacter sp. NRRL B-65365]